MNILTGLLITVLVIAVAYCINDIASYLFKKRIKATPAPAPPKKVEKDGWLAANDLFNELYNKPILGIDQYRKGQDLLELGFYFSPPAPEVKKEEDINKFREKFNQLNLPLGVIWLSKIDLEEAFGRDNWNIKKYEETISDERIKYLKEILQNPELKINFYSTTSKSGYYQNGRLYGATNIKDDEKRIQESCLKAGVKVTVKEEKVNYTTVAIYDTPIAAICWRINGTNGFLLVLPLR